jgi:ABC-2 type transport system permease protein
MRTIEIAHKDVLQIIRDWKSALFLVAMPIIFTLIFGFAFGSGEEGDPRLPVAVLNEDRESALGAALEGLLARSEVIRLAPVEEQGRAAVEAQVAKEALAAAIYVPAGFGEHALRTGDPALTVIVDRERMGGQTALHAIETAVSRLEGAIESAHASAEAYAAREGFESDADRRAYLQQGVAIATAAWQHPPVTVAVDEGTNSGAGQAASGFAQSSPGMIVQFAVYGLITSAMVLVIERQVGALGRLRTTPIRPAALIGGHVLAMFAVVLLQQLLLVALGQWVFHVDYGRAPLAVLLVMAALAWWAASLGLLIGVFSRSEEQVIIWSLVAMFVFSALGGAWFPLEVAGEAFATIGHLMPTAWTMDGFQNVVVRGLGVRSVLLPSGMLLLYAAAFFGIAVWRWRFE